MGTPRRVGPRTPQRHGRAHVEGRYPAKNAERPRPRNTVQASLTRVNASAFFVGGDSCALSFPRGASARKSIVHGGMCGVGGGRTFSVAGREAKVRGETQELPTASQGDQVRPEKKRKPFPWLCAATTSVGSVPSVPAVPGAVSSQRNPRSVRSDLGFRCELTGAVRCFGLVVERSVVGVAQIADRPGTDVLDRYAVHPARFREPE